MYSFYFFIILTRFSLFTLETLLLFKLIIQTYKTENTKYSVKLFQIFLFKNNNNMCYAQRHKNILCINFKLSAENIFFLTATQQQQKESIYNLEEKRLLLFQIII